MGSDEIILISNDKLKAPV